MHLHLKNLFEKRNHTKDISNIFEGYVKIENKNKKAISFSFIHRKL